MTTVLSSLLAPHKDPLAKDLAALTRQTVTEFSGLRGKAIKTAVLGIDTAQPGFLPRAIGTMIGDMADGLNPYWQEYQSGLSGHDSFGSLLASRDAQVAEALLAIADTKLDQLPTAALRKVYEASRSQATKYFSPAIGPMGELIERYASK